MYKIILGFVLLSVVSVTGYGQHHHEMPDTSKPKSSAPVNHHAPAKKDSTKGQAMDHNMEGHLMDHNMEMDMPMSHAFSRNLPMNRNGSGTGWLPDASPMYGYMISSGNI